MTAEIVNLRRARKAKARDHAASQGARNRALFGETKAQKAQRKLEAARLERQVDGSRLDADCKD